MGATGTDRAPRRASSTACAGVLVAAAIAATLPGCPRNYAGPVQYSATREYAAEDYEQALERWTRRAEVYDQFQSLAFVTATFKSPDFRKAYTAAYAKIMDLSMMEAGRAWAEEQAAAAAYHEIALVVYTTDRKWNDLDASPSIWKIRLSSPVSGTEEHPADVHSVREISPQLQKLFPHVSPFARYYLLRFPKKDAAGGETVPASGGRTILTLSSGLGKADVEWEIRP